MLVLFIGIIIAIGGLTVGTSLTLLIMASAKSIKSRCLEITASAENNNEPWKQLLTAAVVGDIVVASVVGAGIISALCIYGYGFISNVIIGTSSLGAIFVVIGTVLSALVIWAGSGLK